MEVSVLMSKLTLPYLYTTEFQNKFDEAEKTFNNIKVKLNASFAEIYENLSYR